MNMRSVSDLSSDKNQLEGDVLKLLSHLWRSDVLSDADVELAARELLLDTLGSAISGLHDPVVQELLKELSEAEPGELHFPGSNLKFSSSMFLLAFSAAVCHFEAGEGLPISHGRPGLHAVPVLLAHSVPRKRTLRDILDALVIAYEVGGRLGAVFRIKPGMHVDGTWGSFAAAVAVARLEGMSPEQALAALNHVACQVPFSLYYPIEKGSIARNLFLGHGAFLGTSAVLAARTKYGGPPGSLTQFSRLALDAEPRGLPEELPPELRVLHMGYLKFYPCTRHMHYAIEAAADHFKVKGLPSEIPDRLVLKTYGEAIKYCPNRAPTAHIQAQFSLSYGLAYSFLNGHFTIDAYASTALQDQRLIELERRIVIEEDPWYAANGARGCTLEVFYGDKVERFEVSTLPGDFGSKPTTQKITTKFFDLTKSILDQKTANALVESIVHGDMDAPFQLSELGNQQRRDTDLGEVN